MTSKIDPTVQRPRKHWQIAATLLVLAGMLPFLINPAFIFRYDALMSAHPPAVAYHAAEAISVRLQFFLLSFLVYGAVILSFLGGVRWGVEIASRPEAPRGVVLSLSVLGALGAWALVLIGVMIRSDVRLFVAFALMFALQLVWDIGTPELPRWFKHLRLVGSLAAIGGMLAVAWLFV